MSGSLWLSNLGAYWLQVAVVVAVGTALATAARLRAPRVVHAYWQGLLAACLLLPLVQPWRQVEAGRVSIISFSRIHIGAEGSASQLWSFPVVELLVFVLIAGIILRTAWLALGFAKLARLRRSARWMDPLPAAIDKIRTRLGVEPVFCLSDEVPGPVTFGIRRPVILLPARFSEMDAAQQEAIAAHELLHVVRRDWAFNLAEEVILTAFWFHPAVWWLVNCIRLAREQVVDREAVELTGARKPYLYALAEIAAGVGSPRTFAAPTFLKESQLAQRIRALMKEDTMSKRRIIITLAAAIAVTVAAGLATVRVFPLFAPDVAELGRLIGLSDIDLVEVSKDVTPPVLIYKPLPAYPQQAKDANVQGTVVLEVTVAADGKVKDAKVTSPPLGGGLDEEMLKTVKTWKYKPATKKGKPIESKAYAGIKFGVKPGWLRGGGLDEWKEKDVTMPVPMYKPEVPYTQEARDAKLEGTVTLEVTIGADGTVKDARVIPPPLGKGLDEQAVETVKTWKFKPATKNGKPVERNVLVETLFKFY